MTFLRSGAIAALCLLGGSACESPTAVPQDRTFVTQSQTVRLRVSGTVASAHDGAPIDGAEVRVTQASAGFLTSTLTRNGGRFTIEAVANCGSLGTILSGGVTVTVTVAAEGHVAASRSIACTGSQQTLTFVLDRSP